MKLIPKFLAIMFFFVPSFLMMAEEPILIEDSIKLVQIKDIPFMSEIADLLIKTNKFRENLDYTTPTEQSNKYIYWITEVLYALPVKEYPNKIEYYEFVSNPEISSKGSYYVGILLLPNEKYLRYTFIGQKYTGFF